MRMKSPTSKPIYVPSLTGHCTWVYPEGTEVDELYLAEAFKCGCLPFYVDSMEVNVEQPKQNTNKDRMDIISETVKRMLDNGCTLTGAGLPNLKELSREAGMPVTAVDLQIAMKSLEIEARNDKG